MHSNIICNFNSFYFIGIGGVSMSGLAKYLLSLGKKVGGSDVATGEFCDELSLCGVKVDFGNCIDDIADYDFVVYTDAISDCDLRLKKARELSKPTMSRGKFLYEVSKNFKEVIAISGCHGKTTCSAMLTHIFAAANKKFTSHIGGKDLKFSNFYCCGNDYLITEACEYKKNFLYLKPTVAVILNSDADHIECYGSVDAVKTAYFKFASSANQAFTLYLDLPNVQSITFGYDNLADYSAKNIKTSGGKCNFTVYERSERLGEVNLNVYGKHNVINALAVIAVARYFNISFECICAGLNDFIGVERRFEKFGKIDGVTMYADYAHHPNEIKASLKTARKISNGELYVVFQPHTYSRTKLLFDSFVKTLSNVVHLLIYKTFAAREYFDDAGSALTLSQKIKKAEYGDCTEDILKFISHAKEGDTVLFLGAGDIYFIGKQIYKTLKGKSA